MSGHCRIRTGFIMAFYENGRNLLVDQLLSEPAVLRLLEALVTENICFATGQIFEFTRDGTSSANLVQDYLHNLRIDLTKLKDAGYLGSDIVERLPPVTIGASPIFRLDTNTAEQRGSELRSKDHRALEEVATTFGEPPSSPVTLIVGSTI